MKWMFPNYLLFFIQIGSLYLDGANFIIDREQEDLDDRVDEYPVNNIHNKYNLGRDRNMKHFKDTKYQLSKSKETVDFSMDYISPGTFCFVTGTLCYLLYQLKYEYMLIISGTILHVTDTLCQLLYKYVHIRTLPVMPAIKVYFFDEIHTLGFLCNLFRIFV